MLACERVGRYGAEVYVWGGVYVYVYSMIRVVCVFMCVCGIVWTCRGCVYVWCAYMCVHPQETNTQDSTDFQVSAERRPSV